MNRSKILPLIFSLFLLCFTTANAQQDTAKQLHYIALVLDSASHVRLKSFALEHMPWAQDDSKLYCHHMTIGHHTNTTMSDPMFKWAKKHEGQSFTIRAIEYGHTDKAFAVKVKRKRVKSKNETTHVTMATHISANGAQVDSNGITDWHTFPKSIPLTGTITIFYKP